MQPSSLSDSLKTRRIADTDTAMITFAYELSFPTKKMWRWLQYEVPFLAMSKIPKLDPNFQLAFDSPKLASELVQKVAATTIEYPAWATALTTLLSKLQWDIGEPFRVWFF